MVYTGWLVASSSRRWLVGWHVSAHMVLGCIVILGSVRVIFGALLVNALLFELFGINGVVQGVLLGCVWFEDGAGVVCWWVRSLLLGHGGLHLGLVAASASPV
jgi:hypothetical protein